MRWFFRRRIKLVLHQIGGRLRIELPSFKLTRRQVLIDRLFHDPKVQAAAAAHAVAGNEALGRRYGGASTAMRAKLCPRSMPIFTTASGMHLARAAARALYRVQYRLSSTRRHWHRIDPRVDYCLRHQSPQQHGLRVGGLSRCGARHAFLRCRRVGADLAAAAVDPRHGCLLSCRRNSGDPLYRTVLARYVQMASEAGVTQAVFPEGGLTMDGRLRAPKFGLLDYMLKTFDEREADGRRDLVFIPVGLNYDRVLEDRSQLLKLHPEAPRRGACAVWAITMGFFFATWCR
jgi:glycerol-3-phosphate O-acyltransferase